MSDLKDSLNKWKVEEVRDKWQIKDTLHYLVKWAGWSSKYNFYKSVLHLVGVLKAITDYKYWMKHKKTKKQTAENDDDNVEKITRKCII
jgi:hypothetical protein